MASIPAPSGEALQGEEELVAGGAGAVDGCSGDRPGCALGGGAIALLSQGLNQGVEAKEVVGKARRVVVLAEDGILAELAINRGGPTGGVRGDGASLGAGAEGAALGLRGEGVEVGYFGGGECGPAGAEAIEEEAGFGGVPGFGGIA